MMAAPLDSADIEALRALVLDAEVRRADLAKSTWRRLIKLGYVVESVVITPAGAKVLHETTIPAFHDALALVIKCGTGIVTAEEQNGADSDNHGEYRKARK